MQVPPPKKAPKPDATIALINVVFLLLIFFIVAGSLTLTNNRDVMPAFSLLGDASKTPEDALFLDSKGRYRFRDQIIPLGKLVETLHAEGALPEGGPLLLVPDRRMSAQALVRSLDELTQVGLTHLSLVTIRGAGIK